jgi:hypothetical protein
MLTYFLMDIILIDTAGPGNEQPGLLNNLFTPLLNDQRDMPFIRLSLKITFIIIPAAVFLFVIPGLHWVWYAAYLLLLIFFLGPYVLMLHNICHRKLFKKKYRYLNHYIPWALGIFSGKHPKLIFIIMWLCTILKIINQKT